MTDQASDAAERADILEALATHRGFVRYTVRGLTDDQARQPTTASSLCLGGIIKHLARMEERWARFIAEGPLAMAMNASSMAAHAASFTMSDDDTLAGLLAHYDEVAGATDELLRTLPTLDASQPLPEAPWFEPGARRSARRVFLHIIAETAQHAGHADIIRESLDGARTMG